VAPFRDDRRIRRTRGGDFELRLPRPERDVLRGIPEQLREVLGSDDPVLERLYPAAYPDDPVHEQQFRDMVRDDLRRQREGALATMEQTVDAERVSEEELLAWVSGINDARLVLGARLDVTEDLDPGEIPDDDPRAPSFSLYAYLTWLEEQAVGALAG
jgi:Domain of unknown function (DUF2017)